MSLFNRLAAAAQPAALTVYGTAVIYEQPPAAPFTVVVIAGRPQDIEPLDPAFIHLWVRLSDFLQAPAAGDLVAMDGVNYQVMAVHSETRGGGGGAWLSLNQVGA